MLPALRSLRPALALLLAVLVVPSARAGKASLAPLQDLNNVKRVLNLVLEEYVEPDKADRAELLYGAVAGLLQKLDDPYTRFMPPDNFESMQTETSGQFGGLGILIGEKAGKLTVIAPIPDTPAYSVGVRAADVIIKVDGKPTKGMSVNDAVKLLRGPKGSPVVLTVARRGSPKLIDYTIVRDIIKVSSVRSKMIDPHIGYAHLTGFIQTTGEDLEKAIGDLEKKYDLKAFVLDLRNNPGGLLTAALDVGKVFLDQETIVSIRARRGDPVVYKAEGKKHRRFPLVVLINEGSASASEIVAGAVKDNQRGILVGDKSYGKGSVQTVVPLQGGSALALTTAYYYTPSGVCIHKKGIEPDVAVALPELSDAEMIELRASREKDLEEGEKREFMELSRFDTQLTEAVELLRASLLLAERTGAVEKAPVLAAQEEAGQANQGVPTIK